MRRLTVFRRANARPRLLTAIAATAAAAALASCKADAPEVVGTWTNSSGQTLVVASDLTAEVTQLTREPPVRLKVHRDPYNGYAFLYVPNQAVFFSPADVQARYGGFQYFCATADSDPMCAFCRVDGKKLRCDTTSQSLTGLPLPVVQDCSWTLRSKTATLSALGPAPDAGPCLITDDGGVDALDDASIGGAEAGVPDGSAADTGASDSGGRDARPADAAPTDTGVTDAGAADTGAHDTGVRDAAAADTGVDAGRDAGTTGRG